jgi:GNAT superfamily N-acetyltransferase
VGTLHIRRARQADLDILVRELGQRRFFADRIDRQSTGRGMLLTAWHDADPIGVLYLWLEPAEEAELRSRLPGTPILNHLEIHADHRGGGMGTKLMQAAERRLRKLGFGQVALAVEVTNDRAAALYTRLGYADWPYPTIRCYSLTDGARRAEEICRIMIKPLGHEQAEARLGQAE